jgi:hypothetical protein
MNSIFDFVKNWNQFPQLGLTLLFSLINTKTVNDYYLNDDELQEKIRTYFGISKCTIIFVFLTQKNYEKIQPVYT